MYNDVSNFKTIFNQGLSCITYKFNICKQDFNELDPLEILSDEPLDLRNKIRGVCLVDEYGNPVSIQSSSSGALKHPIPQLVAYWLDKKDDDKFETIDDDDDEDDENDAPVGMKKEKKGGEYSNGNKRKMSFPLHNISSPASALKITNEQRIISSSSKKRRLMQDTPSDNNKNDSEDHNVVNEVVEEVVDDMEIENGGSIRPVSSLSPKDIDCNASELTMTQAHPANQLTTILGLRPGVVVIDM